MSRAAVASGLGFVIALGLAAAGLGGCGEGDEEPAARPAVSVPSRGAIELSVAYDDGKGTKTTGSLTCRAGEQKAGGALAGRAPAAALCAQTRAIAELLTTQPDPKRVCTQIYGGPERGHVTGTIDGKKADRRFTRTNGCEIADFRRAAALLQP